MFRVKVYTEEVRGKGRERAREGRKTKCERLEKDATGKVRGWYKQTCFEWGIFQERFGMIEGKTKK